MKNGGGSNQDGSSREGKGWSDFKYCEVKVNKISWQIICGERERRSEG